MHSCAGGVCAAVGSVPRTRVDMQTSARDRHMTLRHVTSPWSSQLRTHTQDRAAGECRLPESPSMRAHSGTHVSTFTGPHTLTSVSEDTH